MKAAEERTLEELVSGAERLAHQGGRRILGITGAPGAGKSTLAASLVHALGPDRAVLVAMDGFHLANRILEALGSRNRKGAEDTFDDEGYASLMERIKNQEPAQGPIYAPLFDRSIEESIGSAVAVPDQVPLVITEGNYLLSRKGHFPRARAAMDEVWFLELDDDERRRRLIARHVAFGKEPDHAEEWVHRSDEANARFVALTADGADRIIRLAEARKPSWGSR